jgi:O-6-methylguanine DNA methyltransferase
MNAVGIGSLKVASSRWIALAVEMNRGTLVACTSSEQSEEEARKSLRNALHRLKRISEIDDTEQSVTISKMGTRLAKLFEGTGRPFSLTEISRRNWSSARLRVSKKLLEVPRGKVISYGNLAEQTNSSPRGVGSIMRSNPVPWAVPCHRVIHSDGRLGKLGGTVSGTKEKARILRAEGVLFNSEEVVNPKSMVILKW